MPRTRPNIRIAIAGTLALAVLATTAARAQVSDYRELEFPPLEEFRIPRPATFELDNGIKVFLIEDHELPLVRVTARIRTGALYDPPEKIGLAGLAGSVQRTGGTRTMSGDAIDDFLEARAASIETSIGNTVGFASMDCLIGDFDDVLPVFRDILRYPVFEVDKLEIAKAESNSGIARRNDSIGAITSREFSRLVYGLDSPLAALEEYATVAAVTREDLLAWHAMYYQPGNIYLGVVGDFDSVEMRTKIEAAFGMWPTGPEFEPPPIDYRTEQAAGVYFIEKTDVTQADIRMGHLGVAVDNPDFFALQVMNEILSGGFSGRLMRSIRTEKGLAYGASGSVGASFGYPGIAGFGLQTKSESMGMAVDALYGEIRGMISNPATEEELGRAKDTILNSFIFNYASRAQVLGQQMLYAYYGLPEDFLETYRDNIERVTAADVARVAGEYLHPDRATLLVVGRSESFDRPMSSFGDVTVLDVSIPEPADPSAVLEISADDKTEGREVFDRMIAALGGTNPEGLNSLRTRTSLQATIEGQQMTLVQTFVLIFPDRVYTAIETPVGLQEVVVNGAQGFVRMGGQTQPLPAERVAQQVRDLGRELFALLRNHDSESIETALVGSETIDGVSTQTILVSSETFATRVWIDDRGRVVKQAYQGRHPATGVPGEFEIIFSDYRDVGGFLLPHRRVLTIDGVEFATATVESIEINPPVDLTVFERPAA